MTFVDVGAEHSVVIRHEVLHMPDCPVPLLGQDLLSKYEADIIQRTEELEEAKKKLAEKDKECTDLRSNHQRAVASLQASLDAETQAHNKALRLKEKMEVDLSDLELQLGHATQQAMEAQAATHLLQAQLKEEQAGWDKEQWLAAELREQVQALGHWAALLASELEELRAALKQGERSRWLVEQELLEAIEHLNLLHLQNTGLLNQKQQLEADLAHLSGEVEEAKKAITDATMMAEELKKEQDTSAHLEQMKKTLEQTVWELQAQLEAEQAVLRGERQVPMGVLAQTVGPWQRPVACLSKQLDSVVLGWPPCLWALAVTILLVKEADWLVFGQGVHVWTWSPATFLPTGPGPPDYDCAEAVEKVCASRPDLRDGLLPVPDLELYTDSSSHRHSPQGAKSSCQPLCLRDGQPRGQSYGRSSKLSALMPKT
ncbi:myosin-7B-like [Microcebus murinus]|uniref:myosin-7B-like n=1 Tax=Microcebus murinus TaxID=30608 RepID=UPI003F6AB64D